MEVLEKILLAEKEARNNKQEALKQRESIIEEQKNDAFKEAKIMFEKSEKEVNKIKAETNQKINEMTKQHEQSINEIRQKVIVATTSKKEKCLQMIIDKVANV